MLKVHHDLHVERIHEHINALPNFKISYQNWYSEAQNLIKNVLPDRYSDFISHYEYKGTRKQIGADNYRIRDYLNGLTTSFQGEIITSGISAIPEFHQQLNILRSAKKTLGSVIFNIKQLLQAEIFDSELESAAALAKAGFLRASGVVCGVVLEKHLIQVCEIQSVSIRKKNPGISDLNDALKEAGTLTIPQWRFIQQLADIRNICGHAKSQEPTTSEIDDLTSGTAKIIKTVF